MDLNIDVERAQAWQVKVSQELSEIKVLLKQVADCCKSDPAEDDSVIKIILQTGNALEETWDRLTDVFEKASGGIGEAIQTIGKGIQKSVDYVSEFKNNIGR